MERLSLINTGKNYLTTFNSMCAFHCFLVLHLYAILDMKDIKKTEA